MPIDNVCEYINIKDYSTILQKLYNDVSKLKFNSFGKSNMISFSLEDNITGEPTGYEKLFDPILSEHKKVHPNIQFRSTGFNVSDSIKNDCFAHTDVDYDKDHPNFYNLVIPIFGSSRIDYFETLAEEIHLPEVNAHGYAYYHEFKQQEVLKQGSVEFKKFLESKKIGHIVLDKPVLLNTNIMHRVVVTSAPRCAWVTRWNNIPEQIDYQTFKNKVEEILNG